MNTALTIAGSDSGGGAGIQADLKTFAAFGVFGVSAITALTAQNTTGVTAVHIAPPDIVTAQIEAVASDIGVDAVKTGMLATAAIVECVAAAVRALELSNLVVDPVMIAKSGDRLLADDAVAVLKTDLLPLARVVTPNVPEAEVLAGMAIRTAADLEEAARRIAGLGPRAVLLKGGHLPSADVVDLLFEDGRVRRWSHARVSGPNTHGTGCTFAAALAACLARGTSLEEAVPRVKAYVASAIAHGPALGRGHRPLHHLWYGRPIEL